MSEPRINLDEVRALLASVEGFTRGPWRIAYTAGQGGIDSSKVYTDAIGEHPLCIGDVNRYRYVPADQKLFAAAPDLHRELTAAVEEMERLRPAAAELRRGARVKVREVAAGEEIPWPEGCAPHRLLYRNLSDGPETMCHGTVVALEDLDGAAVALVVFDGNADSVDDEDGDGIPSVYAWRVPVAALEVEPFARAIPSGPLAPMEPDHG